MTRGSVASATHRLLSIAGLGAAVFVVAWTGLQLTLFNGHTASIWAGQRGRGGDPSA